MSHTIEVKTKVSDIVSRVDGPEGEAVLLHMIMHLRERVQATARGPLIFGAVTQGERHALDIVLTKAQNELSTIVAARAAGALPKNREITGLSTDGFRSVPTYEGEFNQLAKAVEVHLAKFVDDSNVDDIGRAQVLANAVEEAGKLIDTATILTERDATITTAPTGMDPLEEQKLHDLRAHVAGIVETSTADKRGREYRLAKRVLGVLTEVLG